MSEDPAAIAKRFFDALEQEDIDTVAQIYDDAVVIRHPAERSITSKAENLARLTHSIATWPGRVYANRTVRSFEGGFVQMHELQRQVDGEIRTSHACIVCTVSEGRITSLTEYFDRQDMAEWRAEG